MDEHEVEGYGLLAFVIAGVLLLSAVLALLGGCAAETHGPAGASCADAGERLRELSCVEGSAAAHEDDALCAYLDFDCVVAANSCTEAREQCRVR